MKKHKFLIVVTMLALGAGIPWHSFSKADELIAHWKFDLPDGASIGDDIITDTDVVNSLVATKADGFSSTASGITYGDASVDGGTASAYLDSGGAIGNDQGSYLYVPDDDILTGHASGNGGFTSLTLDAMIDPDSVTNIISNYVIYKFENRDGEAWTPLNGYYINVRSNGEVRFMIGRSQSDYGMATSPAGVITPEGGWYHLRGVWDGLNMSLYIDNMETPVATASFEGALNNTAGALSIGCILREGDGTILDGSGSFFDGKIDEVQIWGSSEPITGIPGDADLNGVVNAADAAILASNWLTTSGATWLDGDFNADQAVNDLDAAILAANWQVSGAVAQVPEPAAIVLLINILLFGCLSHFRRDK